MYSNTGSRNRACRGPLALHQSLAKRRAPPRDPVELDRDEATVSAPRRSITALPRVGLGAAEKSGRGVLFRVAVFLQPMSATIHSKPRRGCLFERRPRGQTRAAARPATPVREWECMLPGSLFQAHVMGPRAEQHLPGGKGAVAGRIHAPRSTTQHTHTLGQRDIQTARTVPLSWPAVLSAPLSRPGKNAPAEIPRPRRLRHDS